MQPTSVEPRNPHRLRACVLWIAGAFVLLVTLFFAFRTSPIETQSVKVIEPPAEPRVRLANPAVFDSELFKRTIIENNLFRPLGWTPPRPKEPYRLIGTILPTDDRTPPKAILQSTAGNQTYIVTTGEQIDAETEVVSIEGKAVTLSTAGQQRTLRLATSHYLNPTRVSNRFVSQRPPTPQRPPPSVRPTPTRAPSASPSSEPSPPAEDRAFPLSEWQTRFGEVIRLGDARLKNPAKWGLRRR